MIHLDLQFGRERLADLCPRCRERELCIFGSAAREDFGPQSDGDVLVESLPSALRTFDHFFDFTGELEAFSGRSADITRHADHSITTSINSEMSRICVAVGLVKASLRATMTTCCSPCSKGQSPLSVIRLQRTRFPATG